MTPLYLSALYDVPLNQLLQGKLFQQATASPMLPGMCTVLTTQAGNEYLHTACMSHPYAWPIYRQACTQRNVVCALVDMCCHNTAGG
jgi:hypothetical protein